MFSTVKDDSDLWVSMRSGVTQESDPPEVHTRSALGFRARGWISLVVRPMSYEKEQSITSHEGVEEDIL